MRHFIWGLSLLSIITNADYQFEASVLGANLEYENDLGVGPNAIFSDSNSHIVLESTGSASAFSIKYHFHPVSTDVDALSLANFFSRSSSIELYRNNLISDLDIREIGLAVRIDPITRFIDLDEEGVKSRLFVSDTIHFDIKAGKVENNSNRDMNPFAPADKPDDDKIFELGAGYYINNTASIGASYELQDTNFGSLSAYERTAKVYQKSILTLKNGTKFYTESILSFERKEDQYTGSSSREYTRGVEIIIDWLTTKHFSLGASFELEWEEEGRIYSSGPRLSLAIGEALLITANYQHIQSDLRGDKEVTGSIAGLGLNARF